MLLALEKALRHVGRGHLFETLKIGKPMVSYEDQISGTRECPLSRMCRKVTVENPKETRSTFQVLSFPSLSNEFATLSFGLFCQNPSKLTRKVGQRTDTLEFS